MSVKLELKIFSAELSQYFYVVFQIQADDARKPMFWKFR